MRSNTDGARAPSAGRTRGRSREKARRRAPRAERPQSAHSPACAEISQWNGHSLSRRRTCSGALRAAYVWLMASDVILRDALSDELAAVSALLSASYEEYLPAAASDLSAEERRAWDGYRAD